jgi:predicted DNA-binding transcriptional regulator AlpA
VREHSRQVPEKEWLGVESLADWLGLEPRAIYNMNFAGTGPPAYKLAGRLKFRRAEVEDWIASRRIGSAPAH